MALLLISGPASEPITVDEAKLDLGVIQSADDARITGYITAARSALDGKNGILGRALMPQTWELVYDSFPTGPITIPLPPLQSIVSIKYLDVLGAEQAVPTTDYVVDPVSEPGWVAPASDWPSTYDSINTVRIRFVAGYANAAAVPKALTAAMMLRVNALYNDDWTDARERAYDSLTFPFRVQLLG